MSEFLLVLWKGEEQSARGGTLSPMRTFATPACLNLKNSFARLGFLSERRLRLSVFLWL
jgi:hypothetical protein